MNKLLAKLASDQRKPNGQFAIMPTFTSLMRTVGVEVQRIYAGWQPTKLQCCQMNQGWASEPV